MGKLTATQLRALRAPGMYGDGDGLYLKVGRGGAHSWIQRIKYGGRRRDIGLGRFPDVGLAQAREAVARNRALIASGGDPLAEKRRASVPSFREAAERVFEANRPRWRNAKHTVTWRQSLERHAYPVLGNIAGGHHRPGGRAPRPDADLGNHAGDRAPGSPAYPYHPEMGAGPPLRRAQRGRRSHRRRAAGDTEGEEPPAGVALSGSRRAGPGGTTISSVPGGQVVS